MGFQIGLSLLEGRGSGNQGWDFLVPDGGLGSQDGDGAWRFLWENWRGLGESMHQMGFVGGRKRRDRDGASLVPSRVASCEY
jgi:hypothetical protein